MLESVAPAIVEPVVLARPSQVTSWIAAALALGGCEPASADGLPPGAGDGDDAGAADVSVADAGAAAPLAFETSALEPACEGEPYEQALVVTGGALPLRWTLVGDLPPGLELVADGGSAARIAGRPESRATGLWRLRVRVEDAGRATATAGWMLEVVHCDFIGPSIVTGSIPDLPLGQPAAFQLEAEGGQPPYSWAVTVGDLPPGITLSEGGLLSGTPTGDPACAALQIVVTDAADQPGRQSYFICVVEP